MSTSIKISVPFVIVMIMFACSSIAGDKLTTMDIDNNLLSYLGKCSSILTLNSWDVNSPEYDDTLNYVIYKPNNIGNASKIRVFDKDFKELLYDSDLIGYYNGSFKLLPSNNLVTVWETGTSSLVVVLSVVDNKVVKTLSVGSKGMVEYCDLNNDAECEILISKGDSLVSKDGSTEIKYPEETSIYEWNGKTYNLLKQIPWRHRLCSENP